MSVNMGDITLNELKHYGVKGMKWGVSKNTGARPTNELIKTNRKARKEAKATFKTQKKISDLQIKQAKANLKVARETYKNHPAHQTTGYMTTGEKTALKVLGGAVVVAGGATLAAKNVPVKNLSKTASSFPTEGMMPAYLANTGESVSVYWK